MTQTQALGKSGRNMHLAASHSYRRTTCRICAEESLTRFADLGPTPLANSFLDPGKGFVSEPYFPLDLFFCERCSLVQLAEVVDPEILFRDYIYVTGTAETIVRHNIEYAEDIMNRQNLAAAELVIEIASNNGALLKCFSRQGVRTLGVEPAGNIARIANNEGIETINRFFNGSAAPEIVESHGKAKAVIANNVLAHVDDTVDFVVGMRELLAPGGLISIEVPYLGDFVTNVEYDTVYHEHLCYFSVTSLLRLFDAAGIKVAGIKKVAVHGGSLRVYGRLPDEQGEHDFSAVAAAETERAKGLCDLSTYRRFADETERSRSELVELLKRLGKEGRTVAAYGAPAKGNTLLNYGGIGTDLVSFTVDKNPLKVGKITPGAHLPVFPVREIIERRPDYVLILAWNFAEEIMAQLEEYTALGGRFIIPVPRPRIVER